MNFLNLVKRMHDHNCMEGFVALIVELTLTHAVTIMVYF